MRARLEEGADEDLDAGPDDRWDGDWDEDWDEDEDELDDGWDDAEFAPPELSRTLRFGVLSMAPLFLLYELSVASGGAGRRAAAEAFLVLPLEPLARGDVTPIRRAAVAVGLLLALLLSWRRLDRLGARVLRVVVEGALGALLLGPLLTFTTGAGGTGPWAGGDAGRSFPSVGLAMGGAAYEELLFRIMLLALAFVLLRVGLRATGMRDRPAGFAAASAAAVLSAVAFAACHLEWVTRVLGPGGEAFHGGVFLWRSVAGLYLAFLVLWRGVGVAAWAHAFYNLSVLVDR